MRNCATPCSLKQWAMLDSNTPGFMREIQGVANKAAQNAAQLIRDFGGTERNTEERNVTKVLGNELNGLESWDKDWTLRGSNPRPFACKANALPLS